MLIDIVIDNREQAPWHFPEYVARTHWGTRSLVIKRASPSSAKAWMTLSVRYRQDGIVSCVS